MIFLKTSIPSRRKVLVGQIQWCRKLLAVKANDESPSAKVLAAVMHWHRSGPGRDDATAAFRPQISADSAKKAELCRFVIPQALLQMVRFPLLSVAALQGECVLMCHLTWHLFLTFSSEGLGSREGPTGASRVRVHACSGLKLPASGRSNRPSRSCACLACLTFLEVAQRTPVSKVMSRLAAAALKVHQGCPQSLSLNNESHV